MLFRSLRRIGQDGAGRELIEKAGIEPPASTEKGSSALERLNDLARVEEKRSGCSFDQAMSRVLGRPDARELYAAYLSDREEGATGPSTEPAAQQSVGMPGNRSQPRVELPTDTRGALRLLRDPVARARRERTEKLAKEERQEAGRRAIVKKEAAATTAKAFLDDHAAALAEGRIMWIHSRDEATGMPITKAAPGTQRAFLRKHWREQGWSDAEFEEVFG